MISKEFDDKALPYSQRWYQALEETLGQAACRQLGLYAIPDDFLL